MLMFYIHYGNHKIWLAKRKCLTSSNFEMDWAGQNYIFISGLKELRNFDEKNFFPF